MIERSQKDQAIADAVAAAAEWERKRDACWAASNYASALLGHMSVAVCYYDEADGVNYLKAEIVRSLLSNFGAVNGELLEDVKAGRQPSSVIGGNYHLLIFVHVLWLLGDDGGASSLLSCACEPEVLELSTRFWRSYSEALRCLESKERYAVPELPLRGLEKHWRLYLDLIADVTNGRDVATTESRIREAFIKRNTDKRIRDDSYEIEGSGVQPVRWDFRRASIQAFVRRAYRER